MVGATNLPDHLNPDYIRGYERGFRDACNKFLHDLVELSEAVNAAEPLSTTSGTFMINGKEADTSTNPTKEDV